MGRDADAAIHYRRSLELFSTVLGTEHPEVATTLLSMSKFYEERGKWDKAEALSMLAISILEKTFGPEHRNVGVILRDLAAVYNAQARYREAEEALERSDAILSASEMAASST
jgi:tetratricopeptide (TPR) repeat protein